ncbi:MAG: hypothetical protein IPG43_05665 [Proteobacteria bacterium]|nr:hypothetical protein [Pseudomonadota bacterium]
MANLHAVPSSSPSGFPTGAITWQRLVGDANFDYPIDYWVAVLGGDAAAGRIDFLIKWEAHAYCHFHRHLGATTTLVLEGELHVEDIDGDTRAHRVRPLGDFARKDGGDVHMEYGGAEGAVVLFSMQADDGRLFDILDKDMNVLGVVTVENLLAGRLMS